MPITCHNVSSPRNHLWRPRVWHTTATDGGEWWTAQHVGTSMTPSEVKGEEAEVLRQKSRQNMVKRFCVIEPQIHLILVIFFLKSQVIIYNINFSEIPMTFQAKWSRKINYPGLINVLKIKKMNDLNLCQFWFQTFKTISKWMLAKLNHIWNPEFTCFRWDTGHVTWEMFKKY